MPAAIAAGIVSTANEVRMRRLRLAIRILSVGVTALSACGTYSGAAGDADAASGARAAPSAPASVDIVSARFGVFGIDAQGRRVLLETAKFPAVVAAPYGWYIVFRTDKPTIVWREEFELPEPPPTWGPGETLGIFSVSPDRRTAVTERVMPTRVGFLTHEWRYAPGDPIGAHAMRVYIDGQLVREFKFEIEAGPPQPPSDRPFGERIGPAT